MKFNYSTPVRLVNVRNFVSKKGTNCTFLTVADTKTFESIDFMPSNDFDVNVLKVGNDYNLSIDVSGRFISCTLTPYRA